MGRWPTYKCYPLGMGPAEKRMAMPLRAESWLTRDELKQVTYPYVTVYINPPDFIATYMTTAQRGLQVIWMMKAAARGNVAVVERLSYVVSVDPSRTLERRPTVPDRVREAVISVGQCNYCNAKDDLTLDHIKPLAKGGSNLPDNLQCLCKSCNSSKRDRWPLTPEDIEQIARKE